MLVPACYLPALEDMLASIDEVLPERFTLSSILSQLHQMDPRASYEHCFKSIGVTMLYSSVQREMRVAMASRDALSG